MKSIGNQLYICPQKFPAKKTHVLITEAYNLFAESLNYACSECGSNNVECFLGTYVAS